MSSTIEVLGVPSDVLRLRRCRRGRQRSRAYGGKSLHIFFIPGNPGTLRFYYTFLEILLDALFSLPAFQQYSAIHCHGIGLANHHLQGSTTDAEAKSKAGEAYGLDFQVFRNLEFINAVIRNEWPKSSSPVSPVDVHSNSFVDNLPDKSARSGTFSHCRDTIDVMLVGHSIGAYMALEAMALSPELKKRTKHLLLLMPFIMWSRLPWLHRAKLSSFVALNPYSYEMALLLSHPVISMNPALRRAILKFLTGKAWSKDSLIAISDGLPCRRIVENFLTMGMDEIRVIKGQEDRILKFLKELDGDNSSKCARFLPDGDISTGEVKVATPQSVSQHRYQRIRPPNPFAVSVADADMTLSSKPITGKPPHPQALHIVAVYTDNDLWAPERDAEVLKKNLTKNTAILFEKGLTHGFPLTPETTRRTCSLVVGHYSSLPVQSQEEDESEVPIPRSRL
jgi:pimeloyl-ACP methyl ester carboxylesterase